MIAMKEKQYLKKSVTDMFSQQKIVIVCQSSANINKVYN